MNVKPLGKYLLVEPILNKLQSGGGILLPQTVNQDGPQIFKVIVVGSKVTDVQPGQLVLAHSYSAGAIPLPDTMNGRKMITLDQVLAVYENLPS